MSTSPSTRTLNRALLALLACLGLLAGTAATGSVAQAATAGVKTVDARQYLVYEQEPGYFQYKFSSPSGNLRCQITQYEDSAPWGCVAVKHSWKDPKLPDYYRGGCAAATRRLGGAMIAPFPDGGFIALCKAYDPTAKAKSKALPSNSRIVVNGIVCTSSRVKGKETMQCTGPKKASLTMSRGSLSFRQPRGWK